MSCAVTEKLDAYVDRELTPTELAQVEGHLHDCSSCAAEALRRMQLKKSVHLAAANAFDPSAEFRAKVRGSISASASTSLKRRWSWQPLAAFATIAFVLLGAAIWARRSARAEVLSEVVDLHVTAIASANPVDVISSDRHTVKPWFEGKLPFTFNLPELQNSEFKLLGGRMAYLGQTPAAELIFTIRKHQMSVFILRDTPAFSALGNTVKSGFNVESWSDRGLRYVIISDSSRADVESLGKLLRSAEQ